YSIDQCPLSSFSLPTRHHPRSTLFPYTTLFRSLKRVVLHGALAVGCCLSTRARVVHELLVHGDGHVARHALIVLEAAYLQLQIRDRKSTRLNSSHVSISYAVFCLKKKILDLRGY